MKIPIDLWKKEPSTIKWLVFQGFEGKPKTLGVEWTGGSGKEYENTQKEQVEMCRVPVELITALEPTPKLLGLDSFKDTTLIYLWNGECFTALEPIKQIVLKLKELS